MGEKRKWKWLFLLLLLCLCGCGRKTESGQNVQDNKTYTIFYTNLAGTKLEEKNYTPVSDRFDGILTELLNEFENPPSSDISSAMPLGVSINGYTMGVDDLVVDFNAAYLGISNVQEVLLRAGLVKTLVQLPGVMRVKFTVDGQPLTDSDGQEVSAMNEDTFVNTQEKGINSYHYVTLNLYFSNAAGDKVVKEMRNVFYSSNLIMEKVIVEQIIRGPVNERLLPVADPSVSVRSVKIAKGVCVIDLDGKFDTAPNNKVEPETALYAFVNAICDACDVRGVQFRMNGESQVRFRGQVSLDQVFERDADMIEASGVSEPLTEIFLDEEGIETERPDENETEAKENSAEAAQAFSGASQTSGTEQTGGEAPEETDASERATEERGKETETSQGISEKETEGNSRVTGNGSGVGVDPALVEDFG
ncbi:MAG: GerMN domain-containing protein [Lachnospiraceae bacterium]|nr:GerMN domain-containing protein [Lachnospiraceae bacterium]